MEPGQPSEARREERNAEPMSVYLHVRSPDALHQAKSSRGVTLAELHLATRVSIPYLSHLMTGARTRVSADKACLIEDALGVGRGTLFALAPTDAALLAPYMATTTAVA